ncbi:MAG: MoaD/ThiS family protein [Nitrososphaeria archaeon]|jgi:molybdopterin converting factor small subunit
MKIKLYGSLSRKLGKELDYSVDGSKTLENILDDLSKTEPDLKPGNPNVLIFVNDVELSLIGGLKYRPKDSDEIKILPVAHGGKN